MSSKKWEEAVEELKKKREDILALEEKEEAVIALANGITELVFYDKPATVNIPKSEVKIEINDKYDTTLRGTEVDVSLFKKLLEAAGFYAEITIENDKAITLEVAAKPKVSKANEDKTATEEGEQDS